MQIAQVLFFGDSMRSDIFPSKTFAGWDTVLFLEELGTTGPVTRTAGGNPCSAVGHSGLNHAPTDEGAKVKERDDDLGKGAFGERGKSTDSDECDEPVEKKAKSEVRRCCFIVFI